MLKLTRKVGQKVLLHFPANSPVELTAAVSVEGIDSGGIVKVGVVAPHEIIVLRPEVNDPERNDRSLTPEDKLLADLFQQCWNQAHGFVSYDRGKWMELQALIETRSMARSHVDQIWKAFEPVKSWYDGGDDGVGASEFPRMVADAVADLQSDRAQNLLLRKIVRACSEGMLGKVNPKHEAWSLIEQAKKEIPDLFPQ